MTSPLQRHLLTLCFDRGVSVAEAFKQAKDHNITIIVVKSAGRLALRVIPTLKDGAAVRLA